jgi:flavin-dependent dehydrogenase
VLIVGAGPAGSTLARLLARSGREVLVLDRAVFPRPKACGEVVNPGAVALLARLGLGEVLDEAGASRIRGWSLRTSEGDEAIGRFGAGVVARAVPRASLDSALVARAREAGATVLEGWRLVDVRPAATPDSHPQALVVDPTGTRREIDASLIVGADGLRSRVARSLGWALPPGRPIKASATFHLSGSGPDPDLGVLLLDSRLTLGLVAVSGSAPRFWNATVVLGPEGLSSAADRRALAEDPTILLRRAMDEARVSWEGEPTVVEGPWTSGPFHRPLQRVAGSGVLLVGDAAGYYDPLTGQGIFRAIASAEVAGQAIDRILTGNGDWRKVLRGYGRELKKRFAAGRTVQRALDAGLRSRRVRQTAVAILGARPAAATRLLRVTGDLDRPRSLLGPGFLGALTAPPHGTEEPIH